MAKQQSAPTYTSPSDKGQTYDFPPARACENLINFLRHGGQQSSPTPSQTRSRSGPRTRSRKAKEEAKDDGPLVILAFDEAHTLTGRKTTLSSTQWSNFSELRHALRALHRFSCFSLFMSTTGKISQFTSAPEEDLSLRILSGDLILIQPFTDLGFDTLAHKISLLDDWDLEQVTTTSHMAHLGRPLYVLFAALRLMYPIG
jgi:hypothetical protein